MFNDEVKHLTCFYWKYEGGCMHSDDRCLYAHFETGKDADEPKRKLPGGPPIAGRNAMSESPVYNNWREVKMKVSPEPEEPIPPVDVSLLAFVKPRAPKKSIAGKATIRPERTTQDAPDTAGPWALKQEHKSQRDCPRDSDTNMKASAPKTWSQVVGAKSTSSSKSGKGSTVTPFTSQIEEVDYAVTDLHMSGKASNQGGVIKDAPMSRPATVRDTTASRPKAVLDQKHPNAALHSTEISSVKKPTAGMCGPAASSRPSIHQEGKGSNLQPQPDGFTNQDVRTQLFKQRAMYAEVMNLMKAPLRSPEDAVTHTLINLRLRLLRPASAPPSLQDLCVIRYKTNNKFTALTLWVELFHEDCSNLRSRKQAIATDYAAWGSRRVERAEKVDGPKLQAQLMMLDEDIIARVKQLPGGMFLGGTIGNRY